MDSIIFEQHFAYNAWATNRLLPAAQLLSTEQLERDFGTADKSIAGTMLHIFRAERVWLSRLNEAVVPFAQEGDNWTHINQSWPELQKQWTDWIGKLDSGKLGSTFEYRDLRGNQRSDLVWQVLLHLVNHSTHHRGQVSGFLRASGIQPPALDYIAFARERKEVHSARI